MIQGYRLAERKLNFKSKQRQKGTNQPINPYFRIQAGICPDWYRWSRLRQQVVYFCHHRKGVGDVKHVGFAARPAAVWIGIDRTVSRRSDRSGSGNWLASPTDSIQYRRPGHALFFD